MDDLQIQRFGPRGLLVRFADDASEASLSRCRGLMEFFQRQPLDDVVDIVPAYGEVLLEFGRDLLDFADLKDLITNMLRVVQALPADAMTLHEIPVCYDGPDLEELADIKGLTVRDVVEIHAAPIYSVYQIGFSPGFPYLGPLDARLHMPRLANPRPHIEAGSVGIGGEQTGIYSIASAGGWRLIGRTKVDLFRRELGQGAGQKEAFLLRQGDRVKFVPVS